MTEHTPEEITIDPPLRGFMIRIDALVSEVGADAIDENGVDAPGITADRSDDGRVSFTWKHDGWHWSFRLTPEQIGSLAMGESKTITMRRVMEVVDLNAGGGGGLDKLLAGLFGGMGAGPAPKKADAGAGEIDAGELDAGFELDEAVFQEQQESIETEPPSERVDPSHRRFLEGLIKEDAIELTKDADLDVLAMGMAQFLDAEESPYRRARELSGWLLDQDIVEDLFIDDDDLARILKVW